MAKDAPSERARQLRDELFKSDLSLFDVAHILDLDRTTVARMLQQGTLFGFKLGREWRIPEEELRAYVAGLRRRGTPVRMSPDEWLATEEFKGTIIVDPDGWDRAALDWESEWIRPITREEFMVRLGGSTIAPKREERVNGR